MKSRDFVYCDLSTYKIIHMVSLCLGSYIYIHLKADIGYNYTYPSAMQIYTAKTGKFCVYVSREDRTFKLWKKIDNKIIIILLQFY